MNDPSGRRINLSCGELEYRVFGPDDAPPLLFVHGVLANHRLWEQLAAHLSKRYRCIVPTLPLGAHGLPLRKDADLSPSGVVTLIIEFMGALQLDRVTLIGNDSGGALSQMLIAQYPERVERLILTSSDAYDIWLPLMFKYFEVAAFVPGMLFVLGQVMRIRLMRRLPFAFGWLAKHMPGTLSDAFAAPMAQSAGVRRDVAKFLRGISPRHTQKAARTFAAFARPVLIAWSREDRFFPSRHANRLSMDFPNARLAFVDDAYTFSPIDNAPQLAFIVTSFLIDTQP